MTVWIHSPFDNLPQEGFRRQRYWLMAEAFASMGADVVYWTADFNHGTKSARRLIVECPSSVALYLVRSPDYSRNVSLRRGYAHFMYSRRLEASCRAFVRANPSKRPSLIVSATPTVGAAEVCRRLARNWGSRFVLDVQDAWPETFYRLLPRSLIPFGSLLLLPMRLTARRLYRDADLVTGVSERYRALCGRDDYRLYYHGILAKPSVRPCRDGVSRLVYIGNLGEGYDLETVVAALRDLPGFTLDIAGRGPREEGLRRFVRSEGMENRVVFHGYLDSARLDELLAACDVGVIPMRDDSWVGLPYKLGDYLAAGLRVVSSLHGECGRLLTAEGAGETYRFGSAQSLVDALKRLAKVSSRSRTALPEALDASRIYPRYVQDVLKGVKL